MRKAPINTEMLKNAKRRQKLDKAQKPPHTTNAKPAPPDNDKMIDEGNQQNHAQGAQTAA